MERLVRIAAWSVRAGYKMYSARWRFLALVVVLFGLHVFLLGRAGLLPDPPSDPQPATAVASTTPQVTLATSATQTSPENPVHVRIPSINLSVTVADPTTTNLAALDKLLLRGAVHFPTSAKLGEPGNVVIFGHSSYLPVVYNPAYKTFDGIQKLHTGDTIVVDSTTTAYEYAVDTVNKENATEAAIPLSVSGKMLTLSTCDVFGQKSERFIVTAHFVGSHPLSSS